MFGLLSPSGNGEELSSSGEDFSLVLHHDAGTKLQRHIGTKKERDKGTKKRGTKEYSIIEWFFGFVPLPLCPFVPQAVGFSRQQWAAQGVFSEEAELACLKRQSRPIGQTMTSGGPWIENGNHPKEDNQ
jgi:hypothetical protein